MQSIASCTRQGRFRGPFKHSESGTSDLLLPLRFQPGQPGPSTRSSGWTPLSQERLTSRGHLHPGPWLVRKVPSAVALAAGLVCPLLMGKRPNFWSSDLVSSLALIASSSALNSINLLFFPFPLHNSPLPRYQIADGP